MAVREVYNRVVFCRHTIFSSEWVDAWRNGSFFQFGDCDLSFALNKVDRSRLYGSKQTEALDEHGRKCELATLANDGRTLVGYGGTGFGYLDVDGKWTDKSQLSPVDLEGNEIEPIPSSFDEPIKLFDTATPDVYLEHDIRLVYQLESTDDISDLLGELKRGTMFAFPFSYRGGLEPDTAFMLLGDDGNMFMTVGNSTKFKFVGLQQSAVAVDDEGEASETELMDFDMI